MTGLLRFNDKFELFVFLKIHFIIMDFFWKETNIAQKSFFGRQRNRLCDDCFLIWSFQLWATFGWTTQSSISSDKNGWIHFVFLQLIFGLMLIDRRQIEWPEKTLYLSHNMIRSLYLFSCGKFNQVYLYLYLYLVWTIWSGVCFASNNLLCACHF